MNEIIIPLYQGQPDQYERKFRAVVRQGLALHFWSEDYKWTITHIRSGRAVVTDFHRLVDAYNCMNELLETSVDWTEDANMISNMVMDTGAYAIAKGYHLNNLAQEVF